MRDERDGPHEGCTQLFTRIQRGGWHSLYCAHRGTTALSWGLCEHRDYASFLASFLLRPRVARAQEANRHPHSTPPEIPPHPLGEWPRLPLTARIGRAQLHRARSASKKDGLAVPLPFFL